MKPPTERPASNRLAGEKSPYLRAHALNPVDWFPWGEEAFAKARAEDRPIFLSIGYAACHWCHVMARESFEDPAVARLVNDAFVPVKVDREERPDIDAVYMTYCQAMGGACGWPLTVVMTPDLKPFFVTSYVPPVSRRGQAGMRDLVPYLAGLWREKRGELAASADHLTAIVRTIAAGRPGEGPDDGVFEAAFGELLEEFDDARGGFGSAPKFPMPHVLMYLLRYWRRSGDGRALHMVEATLAAMRRGGIFDQVGYGFHRYATDGAWLVPHFEKMLSDQALLALAYLEAHQATGEPGHEAVAREVFTYVLRDLALEGGAFAAAEDADSDGDEGRYYLWTEDEVRAALGPRDADLAVRAFGVRRSGNFIDDAAGHRPGQNVLHLAAPIDGLTESLELDPADLRARLETIRQRLSGARAARTRPRRDDKVLADWNGLMIAALARGAQVLDEPVYAAAAARAADFVLKHLRRADGRLLHRFCDGEAAIDATAGDYAYLVWGLLELYEATFEVRWLRAAIELHGDLAKRFWDDDQGGFFLTADDAGALPVRMKDLRDGATPSPGAIALLNTLRIARMTGDTAREDRVAIAAHAAGETIRRRPSSFTTLLMALDFHRRDSWQVVVAGRREAADTQRLLKALRGPFIPEKVVLLRPAGDGRPEIADIAPYTAAQDARRGKATAYICRDFACAVPTSSAEEMLRQLSPYPNVPVRP